MDRGDEKRGWEFPGILVPRNFHSHIGWANALRTEGPIQEFPTCLIPTPPPIGSVGAAVAGLGLLSGVAYFSFYYRKPRVPAQQVPGVEMAEMPTVATATTPNFCTDCGARLFPGGRYCGSCGKQIQGLVSERNPKAGESFL